MGQLLSLPLVVLGIVGACYGKRAKLTAQVGRIKHNLKALNSLFLHTFN